MAKASALAKTTSAQKSVILIVFMVLMGLGYWLALYRGLAEDLQNASQQTLVLQSQEADWVTKRSHYRADLDELNEKRARSREQVKILPAQADMDAFLDNLNSIAELSGLQIQSTVPDHEEIEGFYARLPVQLEVRGRYFQLAKFLFNIGRVERIINMEDIELGDPEIVDNDVVLKARVLATTFRAVPEAAAGTGETPAAAPGAAPARPARPAGG